MSSTWKRGPGPGGRQPMADSGMRPWEDNVSSMIKWGPGAGDDQWEEDRGRTEGRTDGQDSEECREKGL